MDRWRAMALLRGGRRLATAEETEGVIAASGLFDAALYLSEGHDVRDAGMDPLRHFCRYGWREGRRPNIAFDPTWYRATYPSTETENPLAHYIRRGEAAGLRPICFFDPRRYRRDHRLRRAESPLGDYLARRRAPRPNSEAPSRDGESLGSVETTRMIAASGLFDASLYLVEGPDIRDSGVDPLAHFRDHGWLEGRRPNLYFDPLWYRDRYLDGSHENPLAHYIRFGESAGCRPVCMFDPAWYRQRYEVPAGLSPLAHYLANRRTQRVAPNGDFDLAFYLRRHRDALGPNRDPFAHFLLNGASRDLDPSAAFDSAAYRRDIMDRDLTDRRDLTDEAGPAVRAAPPSSMIAGASRGAWAAADRRVPLVHFLDAIATP